MAGWITCRCILKPASEHISNNIDLTGIGAGDVTLQQLNPLVSVYYQDWFGSHKVHG